VNREPLAPDPLPDLTPRPPLPSGEGDFRTSPLSGTERGSGGEDSHSGKPHTPGTRRGRMLADSAVVEEMPVWLEVNGEPAVTWMCTPDQLEELATGWLHGEGYIESLDDLVKLRPCAPDLGFWAEVNPERVAAVKGENRKRVLASGCGAVSTFLADPHQVARAPARGEPPAPERLRALFKELFARGERYNETGGIHAAALTDDERLLFHAEDIGRHNAVDKVVGAAVIARKPIAGRGLLVTGRISAELAYKAARAGLAYVATPSVPSTLAVTIARRTGIVLVGRAVSGTPHVHRPDA
jgi:FdhD protein